MAENCLETIDSIYIHVDRIQGQDCRTNLNASRILYIILHVLACAIYGSLWVKLLVDASSLSVHTVSIGLSLL